MTSVTCNPLCGDSRGVRVKLEFKLLQKILSNEPFASEIYQEPTI